MGHVRPLLWPQSPFPYHKETILPWTHPLPHQTVPPLALAGHVRKQVVGLHITLPFTASLPSQHHPCPLDRKTGVEKIHCPKLHLRVVKIFKDIFQKNDLRAGVQDCRLIQMKLDPSRNCKIMKSTCFGKIDTQVCNQTELSKIH